MAKVNNNSRILNLPKIGDARGNLSIIEQYKQIPFEIKRTYWIYDVPGGYDRGSHAYKENQEFIVALSGSFDVELDDGANKIAKGNCQYIANDTHIPYGQEQDIQDDRNGRTDNNADGE